MVNHSGAGLGTHRNEGFQIYPLLTWVVESDHCIDVGRSQMNLMLETNPNSQGFSKPHHLILVAYTVQLWEL